MAWSAAANAIGVPQSADGVDSHQFSARANAFVETPEVQIATCPLVENGAILVLSLPSYGRKGGLPIQRVREQLRAACAVLDHMFWPDDISLRDRTLVDFGRVQGHHQITDLYLLALAVHRGGCLASFDQAIALSSGPGGQAQHLRLL